MPHLIIVGGGFGGLSAARALRGAAVRVTLIDKRNYHLFRPMLYQVATGLLSADEISGPLRSILSHQENIDVLLDEVTGISPKQRIVHLKHRDICYYLFIVSVANSWSLTIRHAVCRKRIASTLAAASSCMCGST